uniref:Ion_trans domain-containing protein n=1 Tax=Macrostomum lignano TaxID=282301 RepID=A0A1I8JQF4_9PLAT
GLSIHSGLNEPIIPTTELRSQLVTLERPARELLIWSLLVGKLQMTELFWAMEKEPVAAALLSSKILKAMRTDDFTDKEDFLRDAELFENRAWGVLDQCYRDDESRAQLLINRELTFYGDSSCIYLAAEAKTIKRKVKKCLSCSETCLQLRDFYTAPVIRFVYSTAGLHSCRLFVIGFILRIIAISIESKTFKKIGMLEYSVILTDEVFVSARIFYAFSLSAYFVRLMYIFSFHIALGPKLIMIGKMVVNDLIPFMVILMVFILGYGVSAQSIAYPIGLFTPDTTFTKGMAGKPDSHKDFPAVPDAGLVSDVWRLPAGKCAGAGQQLPERRHLPELGGKFSAQHWNYLRYNMIKEYLERSPLAPPFIVFWHVYELVLFIRLRCGYSKSSDRPDQLCVSYRRNAKKERELAKWEHMKAMDYLRQGEEMHGKKGGRGDSRSVIVRGAGPGALPGATDMAKQMSDATSGIGMELEKKFKTVDSQLSKLGSDVETKVADLTGQERLLRRLTERSTETPIVAQDPRLEERVRESVLGIFNQPEAPPWFQEAARQAAVEALQQTPVAVAEVAEAAVEQMRAVRSAAEPPEQRRRRRALDFFVQHVGVAAIMSMGRRGGADAAARVAEPSTGRVVQFGCQGHRIWRFAPFNFERHQGMRMNVPPEKAAWEIEYPEYYAFDASDDTPVYPNEECHDLPTAPAGQGPAAALGPNAALVVILTRWSRSTTGAIALRLGQPILQAAALTRLRQFCLPWSPRQEKRIKLLAAINLKLPPQVPDDHRADCDLQNCVPGLAKRFIGRRLKEASSRRKAKQETRALQKARVEQIFKGYLDDQLNADNALASKRWC